MRILQIGADRSKRGILFPGTPAFIRQQAYAKQFGNLDIIGFSLKRDGAQPFVEESLSVYPTNSFSRLFYGIDTIRIARRLPRPDVISVQDPFEAGLLGLLLSKMLRVPLHVQVHTDPFSAGFLLHSITNHGRAILARIVLPRALRIRVVSDRVRDSIKMETKPTAPISVLPIFVDVERIRSEVHHAGLEVKFAQFQTKLLVVARLEPEKNICLALRSFAQSAPYNACLIIVGQGSERKYLESLAKELDVVDRVFFEGERPAIEYYPFVDLVLVTSHYEGYGLVIIEALARGLPVLSTDVGVAREAGAVVTNEKNFPEALAQWFVDGPRTGQLAHYPYKNFDEYVQAYCDDIEACAQT